MVPSEYNRLIYFIKVFNAFACTIFSVVHTSGSKWIIALETNKLQRMNTSALIATRCPNLPILTL